MGLVGFKNNNIILFHVAKCAGTSLQYFLGNSEPHEMAHQPIGKQIKFEKPYISWEKASYKDIEFNYPSITPNPFVIGCVRNTFDQIVSHYSYHHKRNSLPKNFSFSKYINLLANKRFDNADYYHMYQKRLIDIENYLFKADYILNFHDLNEDMKTLCTFLNKNYGHKYDAALFAKKYHVNKTKHNEYKRYYTDNLVKVIQEAFADDIQYFGWQFDNLNCTNTGFTKHWKKRSEKL